MSILNVNSCCTFTEPQEFITDGNEILMDQWAIPIMNEQTGETRYCVPKKVDKGFVPQSFYFNHSDKPNVKVDFSYMVTPWAVVVEVTALVDILAPGDEEEEMVVELTRDYFRGPHGGTYMVRSSISHERMECTFHMYIFNVLSLCTFVPV